MNILHFLFGSAKVVNTDFVLGEIALTLIVVVLALLAPFIVGKLVKKPKLWMVLLRSLCKIVAYAGVLVFIALSLRFEGIYPFEARGWTTVIILGAIISVVWGYRNYRKIIPQVVVEATRFEHYDKYLPKAKKK